MFQYTVKIYEKSATTTVSIDSLVETFKIDESLDSALLTIPRLTRKNLFQRFAPVEITISDGVVTKVHYWLIYTPKAEISAYSTTPKYDHTLGLIEPTKWLEKFSCGTLTFTQPLGGTRYTLSGVVERIRQLTPFVPYASVSTTRLFTVNSALDTYLASIEAPQLYFDKKNLREALIETLRYVNAIPRLEYIGGAWVLNADFINKRHIEIDIDEGIIDYGDEASGENYAHKVEVYHENTFTSEDNITPTVYGNSIVDFISYRNDTSIIRGDDYKLELTNKVERMISCEVGVDTANGIEFFELVDNYLFEKKVYDTLDIESGTYKRKNSIYWQYGTNVIDGLSEQFGILGLKTAIENIYLLLSGSALAAQGYLIFRVKYLPYIEEMKSEQYREEREEYELQANMLDRYATIQINPQERINALYQLTKNVYGQIQRLGVDTIMFTKKHRTLASYSGVNEGIYSLGDYTDDGYFVTNKEIVYFNNHVIGRYEMSKNFNRIAQFVNIDKEFRPYEVALTKSDFTLRRAVMLTPFVIELDTTSSGHTTNNLISPFMNTFKNGTYNLSVSGAEIYIGSNSTTFNTYGIFMPTINATEKNVIKYKIDFKETKLAGRRVSPTSSVSIMQQSQVNYTESNGTISYVKIILRKQYWQYLHQYIKHPSGDTQDTLQTVNRVANDVPYIDSMVNVIVQRDSSVLSPYITSLVYASVSGFPAVGTADVYYTATDVGETYLYIGGEYLLYEYALAVKTTELYELPVYFVSKDTSEVFSYEIAIPILPNKQKINRFVVGDWLVQENVLLKPRSTAKTLYYWTSNDFFDKAETKNISSTATRTATTVSGDVSGNTITVNSSIVSSNKNYAIADYDGNLYVGVNQINLDGTVTEVSTIYFNAKQERS